MPLMSSSTRNDEEPKQGAVDFLLKPFGLETLLLAVDMALQKDKVQQAQKTSALNVQERFMRLTEKEREAHLYNTSQTDGRPSKKQRRQIEHFRGAQEQ